MTDELIMHLGTSTLKTTAMVAAPMLLGALFIGLMVSLFQAVTQINEATLTFIPKMIVVALVFLIMGPWLVDTMSVFTTELFNNLPEYVRN